MHSLPGVYFIRLYRMYILGAYMDIHMSGAYLSSVYLAICNVLQYIPADLQCTRLIECILLYIV